MPGDQSAGAALRALRKARGLTLDAVARRVGCAASLVSQVESGRRSLQPWLAVALDDLYGTGGSVTDLHAQYVARPEGDGGWGEALVVVRLPGEEASMVVTRRDALLALTLGVAAAPLAGSGGARWWGTDEAENALQRLEARLTGHVRAGRQRSTPAVVDAMVGDTVALERMKPATPASLHTRIAALQARYAESLSWFVGEAGEAQESLFWIDRCAVWGHAAGWPAMVSYTFVRRSMMALTFSDSASAAVRSAELATRVADAPASVRALAAKQAAYGYALAGQADDCARALDASMLLLAKAEREDDGPRGTVGQRSVPSDDLYAVFAGTCRAYLGLGGSAIELLEPRLDSIAGGSTRTHAITMARLARAAVDAGDVEAACSRIADALGRAEAVGSASARAELRRAGQALAPWSRRSDVAEVRNLLTEAGVTGPVR